MRIRNSANSCQFANYATWLYGVCNMAAHIELELSGDGTQVGMGGSWVASPLLNDLGASMNAGVPAVEEYSYLDIEFSDTEIVRSSTGTGYMPPQQVSLVRALATGAGFTVSRQEILREAWMSPYYSPRIARTVDVHVVPARLAIECAGLVIDTVGGVGYRLLDMTTGVAPLDDLPVTHPFLVRAMGELPGDMMRDAGRFYEGKKMICDVKSDREADLLATFVRSTNTIMGKNDLMVRAWGELHASTMNPANLRTHIARIRPYAESLGFEIVTHRNIGYEMVRR